MSSVGFDIGNSSCVVTVANQGKLQIVLNKDSKNETPSVVSFGDKRRRFGSEAAASLISNPASTISQLKRLIGKKLDFIKEEFIDFPFKTSAADDGEILIHIKHRGEECRFKPVHILAMLLSHLEKMVEKNNDCQQISRRVIGVPSYFTDKERISFRDAAEIAGLKDLHLMHEGAAIALGYRFCRSTEITESSHLVFIDIGHCDTQVTVVRYQGDDIHVLAHASDPNLGGRDFDKVLLFHFAKEFKDSFKIDIIHNPKACVRLMDACDKLKIALTTETISSIRVDSLMDGKDLVGSMKREKFEGLSTPLVERIFNLCLMALSDARLSIFQEYSMELVGSGSQIPIITSKLEEYFSRSLGRMLNGNELVSRGCALQASRLSPYFKINPYKVHDSVPFQVWGQIYNPSLIHSNVLFHKGINFPNDVSFKFKNVDEAFELHIFVYQNNQSHPARVYKVGNVAIPSNQLPIVEAKVGVDHCGIIIVHSVTLRTRQKDPTSMITGQIESPTELQITDDSSMGMTKADLIKIQKVEAKLVFEDKSEEEAQSRRNELEAYLVETRNKLNNGMYQEIVSFSEEDKYLKRLDEMEKWLKDHDDESTSYTTKLDSLKEIFIPIDNRQRSSEDCAQSTKDFEDYINMERASANSLQDIVLLGAVHIECGRADEWLKAWRNLNESLPKSIDKGQLVCVIRDRKKALQESCKLILNNYQTWVSTISTGKPQALYLLEEKDQGHITTERSVEVDYKRKQNADKDKDSAIIDLLYSAFAHRVAAISSQKHKKDAVNEECTRVEQWLVSKIKEQDPVLSPSQIREEINKLNRKCEDQLKQTPRTVTYPEIKESILKDEGGKAHDLSLSSISNPTVRTPDRDSKPSVYLLIIIGQNIVGRMVIQLFMDVVPKTAENFLALCTGRKHVSYLGSLIHQVIPGKSCLSGIHAEDKRMITGVPSFAQENFVKKHTRRGMVSMMTDLHTPTMSHGSGFNICFGEAPGLDGKYVVFGEITEGMDVLDQIEAVGTSTGVTTEEVMIVDCGKLN